MKPVRILASVLLAGSMLWLWSCGKKPENAPATPTSQSSSETAAPATPAPSDAVPAATPEMPAPEENAAPASPSAAESTTPEASTPPAQALPETPPATESTPAPSPDTGDAAPSGAADSGVLDKTAGLALAQKSGCLACHKIESKVVGPPWQEVAKRYKNDPNARAALIAKVTKGGKGNWTEITKGAPMPPYGQRVKPEDIEKLVDFVLSL